MQDNRRFGQMSLSAREAVLKLLNDTERKGLQSGGCVERLNSDFGLDDKDSAFAVNIYLGCIQFKYRIDSYINACSDIAPAKIELGVRNILRMAVYQMLWLDRVPDKESVPLMLRHVIIQYKGLKGGTDGYTETGYKRTDKYLQRP